MKKITILITLLSLMTNSLRSQVGPGFLDDGEQSISISTGINYAILPLEIEYRRAMIFGEEGRPLTIGAGVAMPVFNLDLKDYRLDVFLERGIAEKGKLQLRSKLGVIWVHTHMDTQTIGSLGALALLNPCLVGEKWNVGLDISYTQIISSHIVHTDLYREVVYADVVDGWYKSTASNINLGVDLNRRVKRADLFFKGGISRTGTFNSYLFVPSLYMRIGGAYRF